MQRPTKLWWFTFVCFMVGFVWAFTTFAEVNPPPAPVEDPNLDFLQLLLWSLGGMKGAKALVIAGGVIQLLLKAISLPLFGNLWAKVGGGMKLLVVSGLSLIGAPIALMNSSGMSLGAALVHGATLSAFMVFGNQLWQHFFPKKSDAPVVLSK